jgi:hypothetical protein
MDSMDNFRERIEALEQQMKVMGAHTRTVERRLRWWRIPWRVAVVVALGLALVLPLTGQAKTFQCGAGDVQCLIAAINEANANGEKNTIRLEAGTYTLTAPDNDAIGLPVITSTLTITGRRAETTIIERDASAPPFSILGVAEASTLTLKRLTLRGGGGSTTSPPLAAGGIFNSGTLTLIDCIVTQNFAHFAGINNAGTLIVTHSTITDNRGPGAEGVGGIHNTGILIVTQSTIARNLGDTGGGIRNAGTLFVTNTTLAQNRAQGDGGGLLTGGSTSVAILQNTTIAETSSGAPSGGISNIGGIVTLQNTILARSTTNFGGPVRDCTGPVTSLGHNLIGNPTGCTITLQPSDLTGDPGLGDFTDNGRPGNGHFPLLPTSQAIDAGSDAVCPRTDQLGRLRIGPCDIGAIEFRHRDDRQHDEEDDHHDMDPATAAD